MGQCRLASAKGGPGAKASTLADVEAGDIYAIDQLNANLHNLTPLD
jgi:hypothetical protein